MNSDKPKRQEPQSGTPLGDPNDAEHLAGFREQGKRHYLAGGKKLVGNDFIRRKFTAAEAGAFAEGYEELRALVARSGGSRRRGRAH